MEWPNGVLEIDLGDRIVDVMPTPGHNETEVSLYDRMTALFFSGDFLMPGRLLIDDAGANLASANRVAAFVRDRPVRYVLGGHIEMDAQGGLFPWKSHYHPNEHRLQMAKDDLLALPGAVASTASIRGAARSLMNSMRVLLAFCWALAAAMIGLVLLLIVYVRRRRAQTGDCALSRTEA
jgi:hydroxyacylglutathione hydrolase